jgi:hypothetical protein
MKHLLFGLIVFYFSATTAVAYSGSVTLSLLAEEEVLGVGETTNIHIFLDSTDLLIDVDEAVQTLSAKILFPSDALEVVGVVDFSASAFATPYVNDLDNDAGFIEMVRARDTSEELLALETIGTFQVRVKDGAAGEQSLSFEGGANSVLLNNILNSDVLGAATGTMITVSEEDPPSPPPPAMMRR